MCQVDRWVSALSWHENEAQNEFTSLIHFPMGREPRSIDADPEEQSLDHPCDFKPDALWNRRDLEKSGNIGMMVGFFTKQWGRQSDRRICRCLLS